MSTRGGEAPQVKGRKFDEHVTSLLRSLQYREVLRHQNDFDLIADPPPDTEYHIRPLFAFPGRTAFEFKAGKGPSINSIAKKLRKKLRYAPSATDRRIKSLRAGVIAVEGFVSDLVKRKTFKKYGIQVWDIRTLLFLASKVVKRRQLSVQYSRPLEQRVDASTTLMHSTRAYRGALRFILAVYYQNPLVQLNSRRFAAIVDIITSKFTVLARRLTLPTYASLEVYSLPGITDDLHDNLLRILEEKSTGRIIYDTGDVKAYGFETAPWSFLL